MADKDMSKVEKAAVVTSFIGVSAFFLIWVIPVMLFLIFVGMAFFSSL